MKKNFFFQFFRKIRTEELSTSMQSVSKNFFEIFPSFPGSISIWEFWSPENHTFLKTTVSPFRKKMVLKMDFLRSTKLPYRFRMRKASHDPNFFFLRYLSTSLNFLCFNFLIFQKKIFFGTFCVPGPFFTEGFGLKCSGPNFLDLVQLPFPRQQGPRKY